MVDFKKLLADKAAAKEETSKPYIKVGERTQEEIAAALASLEKTQPTKTFVSEESKDKILSFADKIAAKRLADQKRMTESLDDNLVEKSKVQDEHNQAQSITTLQPNNISAQKTESESPEDSKTLPTIQTTAEDIKPKTVVDTSVKKLSLAERIALNKQVALDNKLAADAVAKLDSAYQEDPNAVTEEYTGAFSLNIHLNEKQLMAKEMALAGRSFCLIGAAGTGKTTTQRSVAETLLADSRLKTTNFKIPGSSPRKYVSAPSIAFCAYTRRASANLQRAIHKNPDLAAALQYNVMTIHSLLEYEPVTTWSDELEKEVMRFEPQKTATNPLTITHLVIEEASMLGLDLWEKLYDALPLGVQIIFIGDINQLPPVFGSSILNFALVQLPIVELTEVYRQQGDSLVLANAHHILKGETLEEGDGFKVIRGKSKVPVGQEKMSTTLGHTFRQFFETGYYDPEEDMILSPYNKQPLGTDNMNKWIAQFLGEKRGAVVFEIVAGFNKHYLAVGDKVMYEKQDAVITKITHNANYHGAEPQVPGPDLSRFGVRILGMGKEIQVDLDDLLLGYTDFSIDELANENIERKQQCSHVVTIMTENGQERDLSAAGDFGTNFSLGYVLTVHKAQGCEWRKVFIILHKDHSNMLNRELFYTAVTRAREEVNLIAKDTIIDVAINRQRIKGNSLEDKIEFFNSGAVDASYVQCTK